MELIPIKQLLEDNVELTSNPSYREIIDMTVAFYQRVGFSPPRIGYFVRHNDEMVGGVGYKGKPLEGTVEIAYGTFENFRRKGIGTAACKLLIDLALKTDPWVRVIARTLPENNFSTRILEKNNFTYMGVVQDPVDGPVWEWEYQGNK